MRIATFAGCIGVACGIVAVPPAIGESKVVLAPVESVSWASCDPGAPTPDGCEIAQFRGGAGHDDQHLLVRAPKGSVFPLRRPGDYEHVVVTQGQLVIAETSVRDQKTIANAGDYVYIPARRQYSVSCPMDCMFHLDAGTARLSADARVDRKGPWYVRR